MQMVSRDGNIFHCNHIREWGPSPRCISIRQSRLLKRSQRTQSTHVKAIRKMIQIILWKCICEMYWSKLWNAFVQIMKCICPNHEMYLSKLWNVSVTTQKRRNNILRGLLSSLFLCVSSFFSSCALEPDLTSWADLFHQQITTQKGQSLQVIIMNNLGISSLSSF